MAYTNDLHWTFEKVNPHESGSSGKISDLFRNEGVEARGHLSTNAPSLAATLMAREVIQNSWDAARELREAGGDQPPFGIDFHFRSIGGDEKTRLAAALRLQQLAAHAKAVVAEVDDAPPAEVRKNVLGLGDDDCLQHLDGPQPLRYCEIVEHGASGMYGAWETAESRMYYAMLSIGINQKAAGSGGTFGYGKAGLIRASLPRVVIAYSCFREESTEPGITRRLLGVTYWGAHRADGVALKGFARFGETTADGHVIPFVNDSADAAAEALGFERRDPAVFEQLGTTFLIVDPSVEPDEFATAVDRNWWPALLDDEFNVAVTAWDGASVPCRPRADETLSAFIEAYDHLTTGAGAGGLEVRVVDLPTYQPHGAGRAYSLGRLALVASPSGWSFPDEDGDDDVGSNRSLVALTREPKMVVEYHLPGRDISRRVPFVRGVFVAHEDVNALLARTEPKAHDKWDTQATDDVDAIATKLAARILEGIKTKVKSFQDELRPPVDHTGTVRLQRLDEKLKKLLEQRGEAPPPIPTGDRPFVFRIDVARRAVDGGLVLAGRIHAALSPHVEDESLPARIRIAFAIEEDGRRGETVPLHVTVPTGFAAVAGDPARFEGVIDRDGVEFVIASEAYRDDWTGELLVTGELDELGTVT